MEQVLITVALGILTAIPSILAVLNKRQETEVVREDSLNSQLQAYNKELQDENRRLRSERDAAETKIDELQAKLNQLGADLLKIQRELDLYKVDKGNHNA